VTSRDNFLLTIVRSLGSRPDLVGRLLDFAPGLRQKLEPLGGVDGFLSGRRTARTTATSPQIISEWRSGRVSEASLAELEKQDANPQAFFELMQAARLLCERDPDQGDSLLEQAGAILVKRDDQQVADSFYSLIGTCLECRGSLTPGLLEQGTEIAARLRRAADQAAPSGPPDPQAPRPDITFLKEQADRFEGQLIAARAVEDFGGAMEQAAALSDPKVRYRVYLQIVQLIAR
jgi:hypothetical protein